MLANRPIFLAKAVYFFFFSAAAALFPFITLYYDELGLTGQQIGLLAGIPPIVTLISASLWSGLADATQQYHRLLTIALVGVMSVIFVFSMTTQFHWLIILVILQGFFTAPVMPIIDNAVLDLLGAQTERYGVIRLWGAIGFGLIPPLVGYLVQGSSVQLTFFCYLGLMAVCLFFVRRLPITQIDAGSQNVVETFWRRFRRLNQNRTWLLFLIIILIGAIGDAPINYFLFLYMRDIGAGETLMGASLTIAMMGEIVVFALASRLLGRWQTRQLLMVAMFGHAIRLLAYSFITNPWLMLPVQILHGFSFALSWLAAVNYAKKFAPLGLGATAQGILNSVKFGLGSALGAYVAGLLYQVIGPFWMFRWAGLWVLLACGLLFAIKDEAVSIKEVNRRDLV